MTAKFQIGQRIVVGPTVFGGSLAGRRGTVVRFLKRSRNGGAIVRLSRKLPASFLAGRRKEDCYGIDLYPDECAEV